jgi:hypothetical protein
MKLEKLGSRYSPIPLPWSTLGLVTIMSAWLPSCPPGYHHVRLVTIMSAWLPSCPPGYHPAVHHGPRPHTSWPSHRFIILASPGYHPANNRPRQRWLSSARSSEPKNTCTSRSPLTYPRHTYTQAIPLLPGHPTTTMPAACLDLPRPAI